MGAMVARAPFSVRTELRDRVGLGHSLDLRVTAEGVETMEQLKFLREHDCDEVQGYLFSHPLSVDKIADLLRNGLRQPALDGI